MEAELAAAALAMKEVVFCPNMMTDMGLKEDFKTVQLFVDNPFTLFVIGNKTYGAHTKQGAIPQAHMRVFYSYTQIV